jgi:hypothetical protein
LSYQYKSKSSDELEAIADALLARFPSCLKNGKPDIESIVEQYPLHIIPRPGLNKATVLDAYLPRVEGIMFIDSELSNDLATYRLTLAEEISHRELEPELWKSGVPKGANIFELDAALYDQIEGDAYRLAIAILMPKKWFCERFAQLKGQLSVDNSIKGKDIDSLVIEILSKESEVTFNACASRCQILGISKNQIKKKQLPGSVVF